MEPISILCVSFLWLFTPSFSDMTGCQGRKMAWKTHQQVDLVFLPLLMSKTLGTLRPFISRKSSVDARWSFPYTAPWDEQYIPTWNSHKIQPSSTILCRKIYRSSHGSAKPVCVSLSFAQTPRICLKPMPCQGSSWAIARRNQLLPAPAREGFLDGSPKLSTSWISKWPNQPPFSSRFQPCQERRSS